MKRIIFILAAVITFALTGILSMARADNTLRGRLKPIADSVAPAGKAVEVPEISFDTIIAPADSLVRLSGYDKPLRSAFETMLVTNDFDRTLLQLCVTISYADLAGRQLHERDVELPVVIPSGATRSVKFKSWDSQKSYYYHLGQKPKVDAVTPYTITCTVNSCVLNPEKQ